MLTFEQQPDAEQHAPAAGAGRQHQRRQAGDIDHRAGHHDPLQRHAALAELGCDEADEEVAADLQKAEHEQVAGDGVGVELRDVVQPRSSPDFWNAMVLPVVAR